MTEPLLVIVSVQLSASNGPVGADVFKGISVHIWTPGLDYAKVLAGEFRGGKHSRKTNDKV